MMPFRERNPATVGIVGIVVLLALLLLAFRANSLPFIGGGTTYPAVFSDLSGLRKGDDVRVAGVKVGEVSGIGLKDGHVRVTFKVKNVDLGDQTTASIRIKTLLGTKYLALDPQGTGKLSTRVGIPLERTTAAFDVPQAFQQLSTTIDQVNTSRLAKSFDTIANTFRNSPKSVTSALTGLSRLSKTVASRDAQLHKLLSSADDVTSVLDARKTEMQRLIDDGDLLLKVVQNRREVIHALLVDTSRLAEQLIGLVRDNKAQLDPALSHLRVVIGILEKNQANLDRGLQALAPFVRVFANTLGNGRWFDTVVFNLPPQNPQIGPPRDCFIEPLQDNKDCPQ
jgi:phospholipid/cholesterol/gamma-HCH transport system substrate-binding protein